MQGLAPCYHYRRLAMKCRYCGDTLRVVNEKLFTATGEKCAGNPAGFHVGVTDGECCVYCGNATSCQSGKLRTRFGVSCKRSPTGMHCLQ